MRASLLIICYLSLSLADAATTVYLYEHFPSGRELNPFVDPDSWSGLLLAPLKLVVYIVFVFLVLYAEKNRDKFVTAEWLTTNAALAAYMMLFMIMVKVLAVANNLMPMMGFSTPISYVLMFMAPLPGDSGSHYTLFWSALFLLMAPPGLILVRHLYAEPGSKSRLQEATPQVFVD